MCLQKRIARPWLKGAWLIVTLFAGFVCTALTVVSWCCVFGILLDLRSREQNTFSSSEQELKLTFLFGSQGNDVYDLNT